MNGDSSSRVLRRLIAGVLALAAPMAADASSAAVHFDIQEQALASALSEFARQSDRQILFSTAIVGGKRIHRVQGEFEPTAALLLLLKGTGLTFSVMADDTILVRAASADQAQAKPRYTQTNYWRLAQQAGEGQSQASSANASAVDRDARGDAIEEEVIVEAFRARTATKTDVLLTETPQAISIITADEISSRGAIGLQEALRYTAGVRTEINGSDLRFDYFSSRGFSATDYLDGMVRPDNSSTARTDVYTLERVEVLRGPSSVLYGQGTAGGIVNSMTKRPRDQFGVELGLEYGSHDRKQVQFDITGPLTDSGVVAGRLVSVLRDSDNQFDFGRDDRTLVAPSLRFQPSDRTDITLLGLYQQDKAASVFAYLPLQATLEPIAGGRLPDDRFIGEPAHNRYDRKQSSGTVLLTHRFSDALVFDGGIRYSRASGFDGGIYGEIWNGVENPFIDDTTLLPRYRYDSKVRSQVLTTDNRLQWQTHTGAVEHNLLGGVDYSRIKYGSATAYEGGADPIDVYAPVYGSGVIDAEMSPMSEQIAKQVGFYFQDHMRVGDATFVAGVRRDRVTTTLDGSDDQVDNATTFRVGLTYEIVEGVTPYVSYAESFIPTIGIDVHGNQFKPQEGTQYEIGVKWQPDRHTLLTLSGFDLTGSNRQQTDPEDGNNTIQTGEVSSRGFEFEAIRRLPDNYSVSLSYTKLDVEVSESVIPVELGFPISGVPKNQASLWGEKTFLLAGDVTARIGLGVRRMGESQEAAIFSDGLVYRLDSPDFTLAHALLGVSWGRSDIALNATNVTDERYYGSCSIRTACSVGYRRNVVLRWTYRL